MGTNKFEMKRDAGWKKLEKALGSKTNKVVQGHIKKASLLNGKVAEAFIRRQIKNGSFKANAPLTMALNPGTKPLVGRTAQLFQAITSKVIDTESVFVGVLRTNTFYDVARTIHDGSSIRVTPAMRGLFFMLWLVSTGQAPPSELSKRGKELYGQMSAGWLPLKKETKQIIIPPRPFVDQAFEDSGLQDKARGNWQQALQAAFKEVAG